MIAGRDTSGRGSPREWIVRAAHDRDVAAVRACANNAYAPYVERIGKPPAPMVADFAALVAAGDVFVACEGEKLLGFVVCRAQPDGMHLENVAVRPECQGGGIGRALISHVEALAVRCGCGRVHLYTNAKMYENLAMYPNAGYREIERRHEDGFDRVYFEKQLTSLDGID